MTSRIEYSTQTPKKFTLFSGQYLRNHWTLDIGVLGYIGIVWPKEHSPDVRSFPPGTPCVWRCWVTQNSNKIFPTVFSNRIKHISCENIEHICMSYAFGTGMKKAFQHTYAVFTICSLLIVCHEFIWYLIYTYILYICIYLYILSYYFPEKEKRLQILAGFATGTIQDTAKCTKKNVSMDWKVSKYSITYYTHSSRTSLFHHVLESFITWSVYDKPIASPTASSPKRTI